MVGLYFCYNIFPLACKNKLAKETLTNGNDTTAVSKAPTLLLPQAPATTQAFAQNLGLSGLYMDADL